MENSCDTKNNTAKSCKLDSRLPVLHPVVLGATETSISLDTESISLSSSDSESECTNDVVPSGGIDFGQVTGINVENSTDVVFGTRNHYHGPVTFNQTVIANTQNQNGFIENSKTDEDVQNSKFCQQDKLTLQKLSKRKVVKFASRKTILVLCCILAVIGVAITMIFIFKTKTPENSDKDAALHTTDDYTVPFNFTSRIYTRNDWFAKPPLNFTKPLKHPTIYVIISHTTGTSCTDFSSCVAKVRNIQTYHMPKEPDIGCNFLIGGDGAIYVGRGWDVVNMYEDKNICISIIGDYTFDSMTPLMMRTLENLLDLGTKLEKLDPNYKVLCHNQIAPTLSPGDNACREVAKLPHYYSGRVAL